MRSGMLALAAIVVTTAAGFVGLRLRDNKHEKPFWEGISALKAGDYQLALTRLEPFAREGDRRAQRALAEMYARGLGVPVDDRRATMWFRRAECQCIPGEYEYGLALNLTSLGSADKVTAVRWLVRAADAGNPDAQRLLADQAALKARGLIIDPTLSDYWRHVAAP